MALMRRWRLAVVAAALAVVATSCTDTAAQVSTEPAPSTRSDGGSFPAPSPSSPADGPPTSATSGSASTDRAPSSTSSATPLATVSGTVVSAATGRPLDGAVVSAGGNRVVTAGDGRFEFEAEPGSLLTVDRPAWLPATVDVPTGSEPPTDLVVALEARVVRGVRLAPAVAGDRAALDDLFELIDGTVVNTLVFDTKDETDRVLYDTDVEQARTLGVVDPRYDPAEVVAEAEDRGYYTVTRIVTFEDATWAASGPDAELAGGWVDAANPANWDYPIALAVEACQLGFDEIQFDYVRFPSGRTASTAAALVPPTEAERTGAIASFLGQAREALRADGCAVSAAIFGIVLSSATDERLGQTPETISATVDAVSPMLYPSHYSPGWIGFADPNEHPGPVVADALDDGLPRLAPEAIMRPWIQGFYYDATQVRAQIDEAEARGTGWIIWNASGRYAASWLPSAG